MGKVLIFPGLRRGQIQPRLNVSKYLGFHIGQLPYQDIFSDENNAFVALRNFNIDSTVRYASLILKSDKNNDEAYISTR
jgi:hypothetical protein